MSQIELVAQPPDVTENPYFDILEKTPKPKETVMLILLISCVLMPKPSLHVICL